VSRCVVCRGPLPPPKPGPRRRTCSNACRQADYRRRRRQLLSEQAIEAIEERWNLEERQRWGKRAEAIR
jgi:hypothetical protein